MWGRQVGSRRRAKKALILCERSVDATVADPARFTGVSLADISRRDIARQKLSQGTNSRTPTVRSPIGLVRSERRRQDKGLKLQQNRNIEYLTAHFSSFLVPVLHLRKIAVAIKRVLHHPRTRISFFVQSTRKLVGVACRVPIGITAVSCLLCTRHMS